jgi:hypothetical protein
MWLANCQPTIRRLVGVDHEAEEHQALPATQDAQADLLASLGRDLLDAPLPGAIVVDPATFLGVLGRS